MIYYATKETMQCYKLKTPEEMTSKNALIARAVSKKERGSQIFEWGCKLFYVDGRKCLQVMHYETKLVIFLIDIKVNEIEFAANAVAEYIMYMYSSDPVMIKALERYYESSPIVCFDKITNRSIVSKMNHIQSDWALEGYRFYDYIRDGVFYTKELNRDVNNYPFSMKVNQKKRWFIPYDFFAQTIKEKFAQ
ncbi:MAG: DUF6933 domain-containing protein [Acutalibacteraceae bacterium]